MQFLSHLRHLPLLHSAPGSFRRWPQTFRTRQDKAGAEFLPVKILTQEGQAEKSFLADTRGNEGGLWRQTAWVQVLPLFWACWVMLGKLLHFVRLSFLSCEMGMRQYSACSPQKAMSIPHPVFHLIEYSGTLVRNTSPHGTRVP